MILSHPSQIVWGSSPADGSGTIRLEGLGGFASVPVPTGSINLALSTSKLVAWRTHPCSGRKGGTSLAVCLGPTTGAYVKSAPFSRFQEGKPHQVPSVTLCRPELGAHHRLVEHDAGLRRHSLS